ncbi:gp53-like domain-containing protein [Serratia marcescens]
MANLPETPQWEDGIYQIEVSDPVLGGPDGISNRQGKQLASRTLYLKQQVEKGGSDLAKHIAAADPHTQYAPKASPTFTGTPTAPTPENSDNSKKLATTEFVAKALAALAGSAPETLDTLKELADALGNDPNFATTVLNKLAEKLAKDQNGADIPNPALFVKNLGLGELSTAGVCGGSVTASGYITIPMIINGARRALYIQWGGFTGTTDSSGSNGIYETSNITVTWPVAFPNAVFQVITGGSSDVGGASQQEMAWSLGKTKTYGNFGFQCRTPNASMTGSYLVIGY